MTKRKGNQIPTQSVFLPYEETKGLEAITIYEKSGRGAYPWQSNVLNPMMALNEDSLWTHTTFGYSVPRQNGKNEVVVMRELYGLERGENILHTAHRTQTSTSAWERLCAVIEEAGYVEDEDYKKWAQKGLEKIEFLNTSGVIHFRTRTTTGGLGESFDLLVIDEAQEYTPDQQSALKYTIAASDNPQTVMCGTPPTPHSSGTVFTNFRTKTLDKENFNSGWCEWSVDQMSDCYDDELWYLTNPSLGYRINKRTVQDEVGDDEIDFNVQRLGLWLSYNQASVISEKDWERLKVNNLPTLVGQLYVGIKYGNDGANVALSIAVRTLSNKIFIETVDCQSIRNGNGWILEFLSKADIAEVVIDGAGGQGLLSDQMEELKLKEPILPKVSEIIKANSMWEQGISNEKFVHLNQPSLTKVVTNCEKRRIGSNGGFGYKSLYEDSDICLMDSALLAHWICATSKTTKQKQKIFM